MTPLALLERLARVQYGLVTRRQAVDCGLTERQVDLWLAKGRLHRVHRNVYRFAGTTVTWEQRVLAAVLAAGQGAVASHRTAARLWELSEPDADTPIEISVPPQAYARLGVSSSTDRQSSKGG